MALKILMVAYDNASFIAWFPQGLGYLASAARDAGHSVQVYQQDVYHWPDAHLTEFLDQHEFDVVMVSVVGGYYQYRKLLSISAAVQASQRRGTFHYLIGGHGPAAAPEYFLKKTGADVVGIGEGEHTIVELLDVLQAGGSLAGVRGIAYRDNEGHFQQTERRELIQDIDSIAPPAYDLFDISFYSMLRMPNIAPQERCMPVLSGRGCTFACNFCYRLDKGFRPRSAASIVEEIRFLKDRYNVSYIAFSDELLMSSKERTLELCEAFIASGMKFKWDCNGRLNYADPVVLARMKEAGCVFINYGIESLDNATLKVMHKGLTRAMIVQGVENTLAAGISPGLNLIYGNIDEPLHAIQDAVEFLLKYDDHSQMRTIRPVTPYPGSELFDYAVSQGLLGGVEDFYERAHVNSDLLAVNFTKHSDDEIYEALCQANTRLVSHYYGCQQASSLRVCDNLYRKRDASFRGFRQ